MYLYHGIYRGLYVKFIQPFNFIERYKYFENLKKLMEIKKNYMNHKKQTLYLLYYTTFLNKHHHFNMAKIKIQKEQNINNLFYNYLSIILVLHCFEN